MSAFVSLVSQDDREKDEKIEVKLLRSKGIKRMKKVGGCSNLRERCLISVALFVRI